jgi:hypothetical protein
VHKHISKILDQSSDLFVMVDGAVVKYNNTAQEGIFGLEWVQEGDLCMYQS